jgi:hypothetical protein
MPGGAGQLSSGSGGQGRGAGAVTAEPSWVAERPRRRDPARSGRPAGVAGREDVGTPARPVVALSASSGPRWGVRRAGRADIQRPRVRCPGVRCPGVRCSRVSGQTRSGVRGAAAALSGPRWTRSGSVWWATPAGHGGSTCPWSVGGVVACRHQAGWEAMARRWPCLSRTRSTVARAAAWPAFRLRRRLGPGGPTWALVQGQGAGRVTGEHGTEQVLIGPGRASWAGRWRG